MNKEWSSSFKSMSSLLKKATFSSGIDKLLELREILFNEIISFKDKINKSDYSLMPFMNATGYHNKSVAYSIYHIFRIEDIVVNSLILNQQEVLFENDFVSKLKTPIITTGNELVKEEIRSFSEQLDIDALYDYALKVKEKTNKWLKELKYEDLKTTFSENDANRIIELKVVSESELANWLIDYWTSKDIKGLILMPMSRHWIMHIEASNRIIEKIKKNI